jgi:hypothetical protein
MTKPVAILAGTAIFMAGCHSSHRSETWKKVVSTPRPAREADDETRAYAANLHSTLLKARVPHKIVTAEFQYHSEYTRYGTARRTVVVYRDQARSGEGWWLMDERLNKPLWLPNQPLEKQISFYLARPVTLVQVTDFMGIDREKLVLPVDKFAAPRSGVTKIERVKPVEPEPVVESKPAPAKKAPVKKEAKPAESKITPVEKPAAAKPAEKPVTKPAVKVIEKPATKPVEKPAAKPVSAPTPAPKRGVLGRIFGPKTTEKSAAKPVEKTPSKPETKPAAKPADKPAAKPAEKKETKPSDKAATKPAEKVPTKPAESTPSKPADKAAIKSAEKPAAKPAEKSPAKPADKPDEKSAKKETAKEAVKPAAKKEVKPAIKAEPSGKPPKKPELYDKSDSTPQATIVPDEDEKKSDEAADKAKPAAAEPPKTSFFKRLFRRLSRA